jgi:hypothetical protein
MLDPRIYRAAFAPVALALVLLAFSLHDQQGALGTNLAPDAFQGQSAYSSLYGLARRYPNRRPGSVGDQALASDIAGALGRRGFSVSSDTSTARTVDGSRTLDTVTAVRTGFSSRRIVVVAHRDSLASPARTDLSGTATLLELARVLAGRTLNRTIVLASTSATAGAAGTEQLLATLTGPIDAVIVLGDVAGTRVRDPVVVPWSNGHGVAPPLLRNTVALALGAEARMRAGATSLAGQVARLAFPATFSEQGPFGARGIPAVMLSASGERGPGAADAVSADRLTAFGRTVLQTITALDSGPDVPRATPYLLYGHKVIPEWPVRLLVLALILPVLATAIDGLARARRRGHEVGMWAGWVLSAALPFALAALLVMVLALIGLIKVAPPGPVLPGVVPLHSAGVAVLVAVACVLALGFALLRPFLLRFAGVRGDPSSGGSAVAVLLVMCAVAIAIWVGNPFAAALIVPALHVWTWVVAPDVRLHASVWIALLIASLVPVALAATYYAVTFGLGPVDVAWTGTLLLAGGHLGALAALEWSVVLGCVVSVAVIAARTTRQARSTEAPQVTVRGPVTYAGPGSLGGTESALRR